MGLAKGYSKGFMISKDLKQIYGTFIIKIFLYLDSIEFIQFKNLRIQILEFIIKIILENKYTFPKGNSGKMEKRADRIELS